MLYKEGRFLGIRKAVVGLTERAGRRQAPHTILISPYVLDEIGEQIRGERWHIENPVDQDFFEIERAHADSRVLYIGRINKRKNIEGLLRSFDLVHKRVPGATLHLAGSAESKDYESACRKLTETLGLKDAVSFLGNVDRGGILQELREATCLILLSYQETAPMVVEEAMAAGVPVIASRLCGLPYMIEDGVTGFCVEPEAEEQAASHMVRLLQNPELARAMGSRGRSVAEMRFHVSKVAEKTLAVYHQVLERQN
jgi:glycosyltransferase involved in cell wall biosynthesis